MYTDSQILYDTTHHYTDTVVHWTWYYIIHWSLLLHVLVIHRYVTRIIATHICSTGTRIYQFTEYRISYYCYHRYMDARYTVMSCLHIIVTHACMISIFLSYGSLFTLHVFLLHVYSCIPVTWLFPVTDIDIPVTGHVSCWNAMCGTKCHVDPSHRSYL